MTLSLSKYLLTASLLAGALPAVAANIAQFNFNGRTLDQLSRSFSVEDAAPGLVMVTGFSGEPALKAAWVQHNGAQGIATVAVWESSCRRLGAGADGVAVEQRGTLRGEVLTIQEGMALQLGSYCFVTFGAPDQQAQLMGQLSQTPSDQLLPRSIRSGLLDQALQQLARWSTTPVNSGGRPSWGSLTAGAQYASPEAAAAAAGYSEVKVTPRQSPQGTGYLLRCGADDQVLGKTALLVLDAGRAANQFSVFIDDKRAAAVRAKLVQSMGEPGREETARGLPAAIWTAGSYVTRFEKLPDQSWLFSWKNTSCLQRNC